MAKFYTPTKLSENIKETPEGFLLCVGVPICRTGWQEYGDGETPLEADDDGVVNIFRSEDEVFRPETIASFEGKALTIKHPAEFVSPENWQYLAKGQLHNIRRAKEEDEDGEWGLLADILVNEARAIQLVKNGLREVSCGYDADYEQTGEGKGIQTTIVGNHLALVEQGRAGSSYAINDEKRKGIMTKFEKAVVALKKKFGAKVVDAAMESSDDDEESSTVDKNSMDELVKTVKDLQTATQRIEGMVENKKAKDEEKKSKDKKAKDDDSYDDEEESESEDDEEGGKLEERLTALEAAVAKLLEKKTGDEDGEEESEDADEEESEDDMDESEDDDDESESEDEGSSEGEEGEQSQKKSGKTGDAARTEILAPGFKPAKNSKTFKASALKRAYGTKDGKKVIHALTGGKAPNYKSEAQVGMLFNAASEVLKAQRGSGLGDTKTPGRFETGDSKTEPMTAEQLNEANAKHYAGEKKGS